MGYLGNATYMPETTHQEGKPRAKVSVNHSPSSVPTQ